MPGLTLAFSTTDLAHPTPCAAQNLLRHGPHYNANAAVDTPNLHLGWVSYEEYPARAFSVAGYSVYFEGRIYNKPDASIEAEIASLAAAALGPERDDRRIERFMLENEGSYVIVLYHSETRQVLVFSDPFCRLPLYYSLNGNRLILAREAKFVHCLLGHPGFDRIGCAQVLAFGLPLGDRTPLEGVKSFPGAGLLRAEIVDGSIRSRLRVLLTWNFDEERDARPVSRQAGDFADLFLSACRSWGRHPTGQGNLVSLSGGHDSRIVAAGLRKSESIVAAVSYRDPNGKRDYEVRYARQVAEALGIEWHRIDLPLPKESAFEELAWLKDGMNWASMAYILNYLEQIVQHWGRGWAYMSGDGGDDCLRVTAPRSQLSEVEDAVRYILSNECPIPPQNAERILKLPQNTLREELRALFESYPEQSPALRIKHFKIIERGRRCYFEGEDRARSFLWQDSPFYSLPLFQHCMSVPDRQKHHNVFCRKALVALSPAAATAPITPSGQPPASWKYLLYHRTIDWALQLPDPLVMGIRVLTGRSRRPHFSVPEAHMTYLKKEFDHKTPLSILMESEHVFRSMREIESQHPFYCLWTVVMLERAYRQRTNHPR